MLCFSLFNMAGTAIYTRCQEVGGHRCPIEWSGTSDVKTSCTCLFPSGLASGGFWPAPVPFAGGAPFSEVAVAVFPNDILPVLLRCWGGGRSGDEGAWASAIMSDSIDRTSVCDEYNGERLILGRVVCQSNCVECQPACAVGGEVDWRVQGVKPGLFMRELEVGADEQVVLVHESDR
jgi:hypothetical protein